MHLFHWHILDLKYIVTFFGWLGHSMDSLCNWSDVWLKERRSEQQVERPNLFIKEEIMLQPQQHIDLLIRGVYSLRNQNRYCPIKTQNWPNASFCSSLAEINTDIQENPTTTNVPPKKFPAGLITIKTSVLKGISPLPLHLLCRR